MLSSEINNIKYSNIDKKLNLKDIKDEINNYTFHCILCGSCCKYSKKSDNTVYIRYDEIIKIQKYYNLSFFSIVDPFYPNVLKYKKNNIFYVKKYLKKIKEQIDSKGTIHTFGWKLRRKNNGDCIFFDNLFKKCKINKYKPSLCSTYPYYIDIELLKLNISNCDQLLKKKQNNNKKTDVLFRNLIKRAINDLNDIKSIEKNIFFNFDNNKKNSLNSKSGLLKAYGCFKKGFLNFTIYDQK